MTSPHDAFDRYFERARVLVILRGFAPARALELCRRAWALGLPLVEIPVQSDGDLAVLADAIQEGNRIGRLVGAGTVTSVELVDQVARVGAAFTVAPGLDEEVAQASADRGLPHLPGVATASEVHRALRLGMRWQKVFPASLLGASWITAMRAPFPQAAFVATGGIATDNAASFLAAGAAAVSLGSAFADASDDAVRTLNAKEP